MPCATPRSRLLVVSDVGVIIMHADLAAMTSITQELKLVMPPDGITGCPCNGSTGMWTWHAIVNTDTASGSYDCNDAGRVANV
jgi:hypothetical protein